MNLELDIPGWTRVEKLEVLATHAQRAPHNSWIIDVGTFLGRSAYALAANCHSDVTVTCIDIWDKTGTEQSLSEIPNLLGITADKYFTMEQAAEELKSLTNIELYRAISPCIHPRLKTERPMLVFLDADQTKDQFIDDMTFWFNMLDYDGTLILDDYDHPNYPWISDCMYNFAKANAKSIVIPEETNNCKSKFAIITKG